MHIEGLGHVHATHVHIEAGTLIVDDLGRLVGDEHDIPCTTGQGTDGQGASGVIYIYVI